MSWKELLFAGALFTVTASGIIYHYNLRYQHFSGDLTIYSDGRELCQNFLIDKRITDYYHSTNRNKKLPVGDWKVVAKDITGKEIDSAFIPLKKVAELQVGLGSTGIEKNIDSRQLVEWRKREKKDFEAQLREFVPFEMGEFELQADEIETIELYFKGELKCKKQSSEIES